MRAWIVRLIFLTSRMMRKMNIPFLSFWNLYGFFGKSVPLRESKWKQIAQNKRVALWGSELSVLN